jgi:hypothetical protein
MPKSRKLTLRGALVFSLLLNLDNLGCYDWQFGRIEKMSKISFFVVTPDQSCWTAVDSTKSVSAELSDFGLWVMTPIKSWKWNKKSMNPKNNMGYGHQPTTPMTFYYFMWRHDSFIFLPIGSLLCARVSVSPRIGRRSTDKTKTLGWSKIVNS